MNKQYLANILARTSGNVGFCITKIQKNKELTAEKYIDELQKISDRIFQISEQIVKENKT